MAHFDDLAENWDNDPQKVKRADFVAGEIRKQVPLSRQMKAMEFGCGTGLLSFALKDDLGNITLVDTSQGMLDVLKKKIEASGVENMSPLCLDLASGEKTLTKFDFIFTMMALHHVRQPEPIIASFNDLLKEGGYLCIAELEKGENSFHGCDFDGQDGFKRKELSETVGKAGFKRIQFCDCFTIQRDCNGKNENFNVFLLTCLKAVTEPNEGES